MSETFSGSTAQNETYKVYTVSTSFVQSPGQESVYSTNCYNVLTALSTSPAYPELNALAAAGLIKWTTFNDLYMRSRTEVASKALTKEKASAKRELTLAVLGLVWAVMMDGKNDPERMTSTTGLTLNGNRSKTKPISDKPDFLRYLPSVPQDPSKGIVGLPVRFRKNTIPAARKVFPIGIN